MTIETIANKIYDLHNTSKADVFNKSKKTEVLWLRYIIICLVNDLVLKNGAKSKNYGLQPLADYCGFPQSSISAALWRSKILLKKNFAFKNMYEVALFNILN